MSFRERRIFNFYFNLFLNVRSFGLSRTDAQIYFCILFLLNELTAKYIRNM